MFEVIDTSLEKKLSGVNITRRAGKRVDGVCRTDKSLFFAFRCFHNFLSGSRRYLQILLINRSDRGHFRSRLQIAALKSQWKHPININVTGGTEMGTICEK